MVSEDCCQDKRRNQHLKVDMPLSGDKPQGKKKRIPRQEKAKKSRLCKQNQGEPEIAKELEKGQWIGGNVEDLF